MNDQSGNSQRYRGGVTGGSTLGACHILTAHLNL